MGQVRALTEQLEGLAKQGCAVHEVEKRTWDWLLGLRRLIKENILAVAQVAPYAPLKIKRTDLDREPVASRLEPLKTTGKLMLEGDMLGDQTRLFD